MARNGRIRVAVDAMGGDYAPEEVVKGAVLAAEKDDVQIFLVGPATILEKELAKYKLTNGSSVHVVGANEFIKENESPVDVIRRKPNCSVAVAAKMVKSGEADALFNLSACWMGCIGRHLLALWVASHRTL
jgi:glycerol-3-phosphate acyltransferase PlsX